tara:strand:- start:477 stop:878 length:402 start_codon:yes stop_codon:yes gene_type:complete
MKTTELRIGNIIREKLTGKDYPIYGVRNNSVFYGNDRLENINSFEPILLTDENILLKLGFYLVDYCGEITEHQKLFISDCRNLEVVKCGSEFFYATQEHEDAMFELIKEIKTVHQLQNLYYALTGKELKLNEI